MTIKTVIEISGEQRWDYEQNFESAMRQHGYISKDDHTRFVNELFAAARDVGHDLDATLEAYRAKQFELTRPIAA